MQKSSVKKKRKKRIMNTTILLDAVLTNILAYGVGPMCEFSRCGCVCVCDTEKQSVCVRVCACNDKVS